MEEAESLVRALWQGGHVDGTTIIDCSLQNHDNDPFLPVEYQKQLKLTVRRPSDGLLFRLSIMYSVTEQLPELFFTCTKQQANATVESDNIFESAQPDEVPVLEVDEVITSADFHSRTLEQKAFMVTRKEHPLDQMIVFSVHEC